ncbi:hypothetical protein NDU88_008453 [Pleurodeles waltl]|uniref:Uncharacterized protein n=1 Tax=Pleurodeles waltl TaxID=8319 RepID=A0AAV7NZA0_PLEWA|nr:hypothetical protein NDU88_008453 [Pleurodeles waltl]
MLQDEKTFLADCPILLDSRSDGTPGKEPGADRDEQDACTTRLSGEGCFERNSGSPGADLYLLATDLFTADEETGFFQT